MEALIIEDEKLASMRLVKLLAAVAPDIEVVGMTKSVKESVEWLKNRERTPDVIFMDVELEDGTCFEIFRRSRISSNVVMVTAYNKYAINAFEVGCVDYLLKPVDQTMLHRSVERCRANRNVVDAERLLSALGRVLVSSDKTLRDPGGGAVRPGEHEGRGLHLFRRQGELYRDHVGDAPHRESFAGPHLRPAFALRILPHIPHLHNLRICDTEHSPSEERKAEDHHGQQGLVRPNGLAHPLRRLPGVVFMINKTK